MTEQLPAGFDPTMAIDMACASRAVYDMPLYPLKSYLDSKLVRDPKLQTFKIGDQRDDTFGMAWLTGGRLFIVFRGTQSLRNALEDMDVSMNRIYDTDINYTQPGIKVHRGFLITMNNLWIDTAKAVRAYDALPEDEKNGIIISGHSLAAAQSAICAAFIWSRFKITATGYTFGQPQVGNRAWRKFFNSRFPNWYRMVHCNDIICRIPRLLWFYTQTSIDMFFGLKDGLYLNLPYLRKLPMDFRCMWRHRFFDLDAMLQDHHVQSYVDLLMRKYAA
jgi:hypothetical protein